MSWYTAYWPAYLMAVVACFAIPEWRAIKNRQRGDTLSENIRLWLRVDTPGGGFAWLLVWGMLQAVLLWLLGHIHRWWA